MRLAAVQIEKFRCLEEIEIEFDDVTVSVGANGSGKSSVLRGLEWFFNGGALDSDDVWAHEEDAVVSVSATFDELTDADRAALGSYGTGKTARFWRTWSEDSGEKLTGRGLAYPPFEEVRAHTGMLELRAAYKDLAESQPELKLPSVGSGAKAKAAMDEWEKANPDRLEAATSSATHLFGVVGQPRLAGRFDYVFIPAVSDADEETRDARGTLLARLLERSSADHDRIQERFDALLVGTRDEIAKVVQEEHGSALVELADRVTASLQQYVRDATVTLEVAPPVFRIPAPSFDMRVADGGIETAVARQGHGFQRALLMATLQELATSDASEDVPAILLAIEEPELYQHPVQARHFASVLASLPRRGEAAFQVAYATHSAFFVDPTRYEQLRRFSRRRDDGKREITVASTAGVASRLAGLVPEEEIATRIGLTLRRTLGEAVFADAVLLVEGMSDAGFLSGAADRDGGFESRGIAVVHADGKTLLATAWAILTELGVPTFVVFDGDRGVGERMRAQGKDEGDIGRAATDASRWNRRILGLLGAHEEDWPATQVQAAWAVAEDDLESIWPEMVDRARQLAADAGDSRQKPEEWYREAACKLDAPLPEFVQQVVDGVSRLR